MEWPRARCSPAPRHSSLACPTGHLCSHPAPATSPQEEVSSPSFSCSQPCLLSDPAQAQLLQTCFAHPRSSANRGLPLVPESRVPAAQCRGAHQTLLVAPKNVSREYDFSVEENVLIYNIYIFIFIPVQSYHVMFTLIFLGRKGPGRKMLPGAFGRTNAALLSLFPLS